MRYERCKAWNRPFFKGKPCEMKCGKVFAKSDKIVVVDIPTNWFRGDDIVKAYCPECFAKEYPTHAES